ncbi:MAG TPA: phosphoribosylformylglycinamidine cyclo-ligase [Candidatus Hydrogenedentes bacterium]|nr:phosphoribosylformylglycinamidine cyclo-ligase [Candidatus Hydrogenedentota bacterium]HQM50566.1 phosphoribosylformylglycinamidine cyclo-ligase [Candidatus Hydrogenedentota bacterium]
MDPKKPGLSYRDAGVNIDAADEALRSVKDIVKKTFTPGVLRDIGTFGAMFQLDLSNYAEPVLVSSVDGVGTKLKIAFALNKHDTVGIDLVSHCVNDILVQGARPLFFLDYLAFGRLEPKIAVDVITGLSNGCRYAGCALIGGETAEMPGLYNEKEYDLAGTIVGIVDKSKIIDGAAIQESDVIIALGSSGLHTNGYSLARKICFEVAGLGLHDEMPYVGRPVGEALLEPHRSYSRVMQVVQKIATVNGMVHITGGGVTDNLPRVLPEGMAAEIDLNAWEALPIFRFLQETGNVTDAEMLRTFNMGAGFLVIVSKTEAEKTLKALSQACEEPKIVGRVIAGDHKVHYTGKIRYGTSN